MNRFVRMEVPEVTEFEVYMDIDGAVEEDEDSVQSGNGPEPFIELDAEDEEEQSVQLPWQSYENGLGSGSGDTLVPHAAAQEREWSGSGSSMVPPAAAAQEREWLGIGNSTVPSAATQESEQLGSGISMGPPAAAQEREWPGSGNSIMPSAATQEIEWPVASTSGHSTLGHDSDNEEVDVDTPFDGKLMGQTQVKSEPTSQLSVFSGLMNLAGLSSLVSAAKKSVDAKKNAVAKKSTTQKKANGSAVMAKTPTVLQIGQQQVFKDTAVKTTFQNVVSSTVSKTNIAKKSTSKPPKSLVNSFGLKSKQCKAKTGNVLQVKFGPGQSLSKGKSHADVGNLSPPKMSVFKKSLPASQKIPQGMPKVGVPTLVKSNRATSLMSNTPTGKKMFPAKERSGDRIACPECSVVVKSYCLRAHLKTVHNLPMKNCKRCRISFTDLNLFSEHYALHLQEQEDRSSGILDSPFTQRMAIMSKTNSFGADQSTNPKVVKKELSSSITSELPSVSRISSETSSSRISSETPSAPSEVTSHTKLLQKLASAKKRQLSPSVPSGPSSKFIRLSDEIQSMPDDMAFLLQPKLPPKPRKPSFHPKKKKSSLTVATKLSDVSPVKGFAEMRDRPASPRSKTGYDSALSHKMIVSALPKLPPKPRKPFYSPKRRQLSPAVDTDSKHSHSETSGSPVRRCTGDRRHSATSLQSEEVSILQVTERKRPSSVFYKDTQKTAYRRGQAPVSSRHWHQSPSKRTHFESNVTSPVSRKYGGKATVSLVSLETASRPYDCKTCLAAFHVALLCPRSFRRHSQAKSYACTRCSASFTQPDHLETHQNAVCRGVLVKIEREDDDLLHTALRRHHVSSSSPSEEFVQNVPVKSYGQGGSFECHVCKEVFLYRSMLLRHIPYHSFQYCCGICKKAFVKKVDLLDHLQIMHDGRMLLRCRYCENKFEDISEFDSHILAHKDGTVVACTVCNKVFCSSKQMQVHLNTAHGISQNATVCKVCGKKYKQARHLTLHMRFTHKASKTAFTKFMSCRFCRKVFHTKQGLATHYRLRHGLSLASALSAISFKNVKNVDSPQDPSISYAESKTPLPVVETETVPAIKLNSGKCHICGKKYSQKKVLVSHYRNIHNVEPYGKKVDPMKCQICGKLLYSLQGLKVHYKVRHRRGMPKPKPDASGECLKQEGSKTATSTPTSGDGPEAAATSSGSGAPYECGKCGRFFSQSWSLYRHERLYHRKSVKGTVKARPVLIQESRPRLCTQTSLKEKLVSRQKRKTWLCPVCRKPFVLRKTMRMHVKAEHPESFIDERCGVRKCSKCGKTFLNKTSLLAHSKICGFKKMGSEQSVWNTSAKHGEFKCTLCERTFRWRQNIMRHMQTSHKLSKAVVMYNLTHQKLAQSQKSNPESEKSISAECKYYLCKLCKVCFTKRRPLMRHRRRKHGGKPGLFQCRARFCSKIYAKNKALISHMRKAHPGMSLYMCHGCSSGFDTSNDLFSHRCSLGVQSGSVANPQFEDYDEEEYSQEEWDNSLSEQECRYRCMTCGIGFHIAREWTKHMQEHSEDTVERSENKNENADCHRQAMDATNKIKVSIFDVMSSNSVFVCRFCHVVFTDENTMKVHTCVQSTGLSTAINTPPNKKDKRKKRKLQPVKCTVCSKLFSPLSIKRHMLNIHSLSARICAVCSIVFTDLQSFKRHNEEHVQNESIIEEETGASSADDEPSEDSVTFFICQMCGDLFPDADSLESHVCTDSIENSEETAVHQRHCAQDFPTDLQETNHHESSVPDTDRATGDFRMVGQSAQNMFTNSNSKNERMRENQNIETAVQTLENSSTDAVQTTIEVENGTISASADSDVTMAVEDLTKGYMRTESDVSTQNLVPSHSLSVSLTVMPTNCPPETQLNVPNQSKTLPSGNFEETTTGPLEQFQSVHADHFLPVSEPSFDVSLETAATGLDKVDTVSMGQNKVDNEPIQHEQAVIRPVGQEDGQAWSTSSAKMESYIIGEVSPSDHVNDEVDDQIAKSSCVNQEKKDDNFGIEHSEESYSRGQENVAAQEKRKEQTSAADPEEMSEKVMWAFRHKSSVQDECLDDDQAIQGCAVVDVSAVADTQNNHEGLAVDQPNDQVDSIQ